MSKDKLFQGLASVGCSPFKDPARLPKTMGDIELEVAPEFNRQARRMLRAERRRRQRAKKGTK